MTWVERRIEHLATEVRDSVDPAVFGSGDVEHYSIPALDATGLPEMQSAAEIQSHKQMLRGGEVLVSRLNPRKARVLTVPVLGEHPALCSGEFVVLRPTDVDVRFLEYALLSERTRQELDGAVQSVTRSHQRVRPEQLLKMKTLVPRRQTQQAIADYLDTETARIDALIAKKRRMIDLVREHLDGAREAVIWGDAPPSEPLMRAVDSSRPIMYGIVLPGPDVHDGVPIVKGGDVASEFSRPLCRTTREIERSYGRSRLASDDLVFAIRGGVGDVAIVPPAAAGSNITQDVARVAPAASVDGRWLRHVLLTPRVQAEAEAKTTGATIRGLNIWELERLRIPQVSGAKQREQLARLAVVESRCVQLVNTAARQIGLLQEHRQALITAAVTGELEIPGAAA